VRLAVPIDPARFSGADLIQINVEAQIWILVKDDEK
jgi:hypothetical protein